MKFLKILFIPLIFFLFTIGCLEKSDTVYQDIVTVNASAEKQSVSTAGGILVFSKSGIQLDIERGDLSKSSQVTLKNYSVDDFPGQKVPNTFTCSSNYFTFENIFIKNGKQIRLTLPYNSSTVSMQTHSLAENNLDRLNIYIYDADKEKWLPVQNGRTVNTVSKTISVLTDKINAVIAAIDSEGSSTGTSTAKAAAQGLY